MLASTSDNNAFRHDGSYLFHLYIFSTRVGVTGLGLENLQFAVAGATRRCGLCSFEFMSWVMHVAHVDPVLVFQLPQLQLRVAL